MKTFTDKVKVIKVQDKDGNEASATIEKKTEKVCDHKIIRQIAPTIFVCNECEDMYFLINHWINAPKAELLSWMQQLADHLDDGLEKTKE